MAITETNPFRFDDVEQRVKLHIQHPYLVLNKVRRSVSRFHFGVLVALLQAAKVEWGEAEKVVDAALLLQHGLSIHDDVDTHVALQRQLIVLAGDYSSSHYYAVLARLGNFRLMSKLCEAVVRINEAKMALYDEESPVPDDIYMKLSTIIHGDLFTALIDYYSLDRKFWGDQVESLVRAYVVYDELQRFGELRHVSVRRSNEWLSDAMNRILNQANNGLEPVASFFLESLTMVQDALDHQTVAEENQ